MTPLAYSVLGFRGTHEVLAAEKLLEGLGMVVKVVPAPKSLGGSLCGIALRLREMDRKRALEELETAGIQLAGSVDLSGI